MEPGSGYGENEEGEGEEVAEGGEHRFRSFAQT